ncbi:hypothetical protein EDB89DRAFT_1914809 [Lactarius sanguifluus]|nr:hypothetical protein EDB89DRAFT_1914809 [Lactarius sanguifluus]
MDKSHEVSGVRVNERAVSSKYTKIELNGQIEYAEVQFYFLHFTSDNPEDVPLPYALVSIYSHPVREMLLKSSYTLWACQYQKSGLEDAKLTGSEETLDGEQGHGGEASTVLD